MSHRRHRSPPSSRRSLVLAATLGSVCLVACSDTVGLFRIPTAIKGVVQVGDRGLSEAQVEITRPGSGQPVLVATDSMGAYGYALEFSGFHRLRVTGYDRGLYLFRDSVQVIDARFTGAEFEVDFVGEPRP